MVESVPHRGAPVLHGCVERYTGYRISGAEPGTHLGLPSTTLTFILSFDDPLELVSMPDRHQSPGSWWSVVGGLHTAPAVIRHHGNQHGIQVELTPAAARRIFGLPPAAITGSVVSLEDLLGGAGRTLHERVSDAPDWAARFGVLDRELGRIAAGVDDAVATRSGPGTELGWAWSSLRSANDGAGDDVRIDSLAREIGWSRRHLSTRFRAEFGLSPRVVRRVARFERARTLLDTPTPLASVAAAAGYSDQPHLSREWKEFTGLTPTQWRRRDDLPFVHDLDAAAGS